MQSNDNQETRNYYQADQDSIDNLASKGMYFEVRIYFKFCTNFIFFLDAFENHRAARYNTDPYEIGQDTIGDTIGHHDHVVRRLATDNCN